MQMTRDAFVGQFAISIGVHSMKMWSRREKDPPLHVSTSVYEVIRTGRGELPFTSAGFAEIVHPVITELHRRTPKGERPDPMELTRLIYDALDRAGVEVTLRPPTQAHGGRQG